jgi:hypothetical protein
MKVNLNWLEESVFEYISNNPGVERIDVVHHFKIVEKTMYSISNLEKQGKIRKEWTPFQLPQGTTRLYPIQE